MDGAAGSLHLEVRGEGEAILFVHGSFGDSSDWEEQRPLAERYRLLLLDRRGYGDSPARQWSYGFEEETAEVAGFLDGGVHLVGSSYGGVVALLAAAARPDAVRSLTVIEPPAFGLARGDPDVEDFVARIEPVYLAALPTAPEAFRTAFRGVFGAGSPSPMLTERERRNARATMMEAFPWQVDLPLERLAAAPFPKLVVSGAWGGRTMAVRDRAGRAFDLLCRTLAECIGGQYAVIAGRGHDAQRTGTPFNTRLELLLAAR